MTKHHYGGKKNEQGEYYCLACKKYHPSLNAEKVIKLYNEGNNMKKIAGLLGYSKSRVQETLAKHKDEIRKPLMTSKGKEGLNNGWLGKKAQRWGFSSINQMVEWLKFHNQKQLERLNNIKNNPVITK